MLASALLELCNNPNYILEELNHLGIPGIIYVREITERYGVKGSHLRVFYKGQEEKQGGQSGNEIGNDSCAVQRESYSLEKAFEIIEGLQMSQNSLAKVREVYQVIAEAEAQVHGTDLGHIHLCELGTMDAIADICAVCHIIQKLDVSEIVVSPVRTGFGRIETRHGKFPVPAPATAVLLCGIPSFAGSMEGELCTPTGVALIKMLATDYGRSPAMVTEKIGYGIGDKDFGQLTCVRAVIGREITF